MMDTNQNIVSSYTYDAYGNIINITGEIGHINPYRYRGYYYDSETALYYCNMTIKIYYKFIDDSISN